MLARVAHPFAVFVERYYPDPFVFVVLLTGATAVLAWWGADARPLEIINAWGDGLSGLMGFIAQVAIMLVAAHALAHTGPVSNALAAAARLPRNEWQAYVMVSLVTAMASLFVWSFGFVGGAIIARQVAIEGARRGLRIHYPLLVATAYAATSVWHMGYSSSAALFVATEGHAMSQLIGVVPVTQTIFSSWNLITMLAAVFTACVICVLMRPKPVDAVPIDTTVLQTDTVTAPPAADSTWGSRLDQARILNLIFGAALVVYLWSWFARKGLVIDFNIVIWTILSLLLLLSRSPIEVVHLIRGASGTVGLILLQYPFYAGIMGIMLGTGLVTVISDWFITLADQHTLTLWAFVSAGVVNLFVPSGGGQWVVQGPAFLQAAQALGVEPARIVMAVAYGDQWTNLIQPFWTIPLLAIAGLSVRHILGYCFVVLISLFVVYATALLML